jgi:hypothetical protein
MNVSCPGEKPGTADALKRSVCRQILLSHGSTSLFELIAGDFDPYVAWFPIYASLDDRRPSQLGAHTDRQCLGTNLLDPSAKGVVRLWVEVAQDPF